MKDCGPSSPLDARPPENLPRSSRPGHRQVHRGSFVLSFDPLRSATSRGHRRLRCCGGLFPELYAAGKLHRDQRGVVSAADFRRVAHQRSNLVERLAPHGELAAKGVAEGEVRPPRRQLVGSVGGPQVG